MRKTYIQIFDKRQFLIRAVSQNEKIKEKIKGVYSEERLQEGIELCEKTKSIMRNHDLTKTSSRILTNRILSIQTELNKLLVRVRKTCRYFYKKDITKKEALGLDKSIPEVYVEWVGLLKTTLIKVNEDSDILKNIALFDINKSDIENALTKIEELESLKIKATSIRGTIQVQTQQKKLAFKKLNAYCADLKECLHLFYSNSKERQTLEQVGITVK